MATPGPPSSSLVTFSPSDSATTGGPAVKIAACALITVKSDIGATSAPWPADEPSTAVMSGTCPEQRDCESRSVGARPYALPSARKPAPSSIITSGTRSRRASSAARYRFEFAVWLMVPASTVKSSAATITGRPLTLPEPSTMASAGASSPPVSVPSSMKEPGSTSASMRARASSLPWPWCLARRSGPPMARPAARRCSRSTRLASHSSLSSDIGIHFVTHPRELRDELELVGPVGADDGAGDPVRNDVARFPLLTDARRRADQRALQQGFVGHRRDRLLPSSGEEQLLNARRVVREATLGHRLDVVVVRLAAHAADVRGAVRADAVEPALHVVGDLHGEAVEHVEVGMSVGPTREALMERAHHVGIVGATRRQPHRQPAVAQLR